VAKIERRTAFCRLWDVSIAGCNVGFCGRGDGEGKHCEGSTYRGPFVPWGEKGFGDDIALGDETVSEIVDECCRLASYGLLGEVEMDMDMEMEMEMEMEMSMMTSES